MDALVVCAVCQASVTANELAAIARADLERMFPGPAGRLVINALIGEAPEHICGECWDCFLTWLRPVRPDLWTFVRKRMNEVLRPHP